MPNATKKKSQRPTKLPHYVGIRLSETQLKQLQSQQRPLETMSELIRRLLKLRD